MAQYLVVWKIDIDAESPRAAAEFALAIQRRTSTATVFDVTDEDGRSVIVDLDDDD